MYHTMTIAGLERDLPLCRVNDELYIGAFVIFGDPELTVACAEELLKRAPEYDYIVTAEAKGISKWVIILKHGLRNALIPIITIAGTQLGDIFTGSILIESIFAMPGMGKLLLDAINARDLPLIQGGVMYIALICVVVYLVVDILYGVADPRIRLGEEAAE